ncbi:MAG: hypothetical protein SNJ84_03430 [Verrucomicrobiia bacterium]
MNADSTLRPVSEPDELVRAGTSSTNGRAIVIPFQLPTLGAGETFASAQLSLTLMEIGPSRITGSPGSGGITPTYSLDLYGLNHRSSSSVLGGDFYQGATPQSGVTLVQAAFITPSTTLGTVTLSGAALLDYLNNQYDNGANAGQWIFLRLSPNSGPVTSLDQRYRISMADYSNPPNPWSAVIPQIEYTVIPEPGVTSLLVLGFLSLLCGLRQRGVFSQLRIPRR